MSFRRMKMREEIQHVCECLVRAMHGCSDRSDSRTCQSETRSNREFSLSKRTRSSQNRSWEQVKRVNFVRQQFFLWLVYSTSPAESPPPLDLNSGDLISGRIDCIVNSLAQNLLSLLICPDYGYLCDSEARPDRNRWFDTYVIGRLESKYMQERIPAAAKSLEMVPIILLVVSVTGASFFTNAWMIPTRQCRWFTPLLIFIAYFIWDRFGLLLILKYFRVVRRVIYMLRLEWAQGEFNIACEASHGIRGL